MIVILRRIRQAAGRVTGTDWLLIAVEGLLVFLGIVAAFQLEQWAEERREQRDRQALLERLVDEAEDSVVLLRSQRDSYEAWRQSARAELDAWLNDRQCPGANISFRRFYPSLYLPTAVYDEMVGSGGLAILPGSIERRAVSRFHGNRQAYSEQLGYFRQLVTGGLDEWADMGYAPMFDPEIDGSAAYRYDRMGGGNCDNPALKLNTLNEMRSAEVMQELRTALTEDAIAMCAVLARSAGRTCSPRDVPLEGRDALLARDAVREEAE